MHKERLTSLADGIFAIVMTLLVLEIRIPQLGEAVTDVALFEHLLEMLPTFFSYVLSFVVLFTYWRAHHFIVSGFARNIDSRLININAVFFIFVTLVPFSAALLGQYNDLQLTVILFSLHVILLGLILYWMRNHILFAETIENEELAFHSLFHSNIRVAVPIVFAVLAILLSFFNITFSLALLTIAVIFNMFTQSAYMVDWMLQKLFHIKVHQKNS